MQPVILLLAPLLAPQNQWLPQGTTKPPLPAFQQDFGQSVALDGTTVVVGIPGDDLAAEDAGAVEVYELMGTGPELRATLRASDAEEGAAFGFEVDCDGDVILVWAPQSSVSARAARTSRSTETWWWWAPSRPSAAPASSTAWPSRTSGTERRST